MTRTLTLEIAFALAATFTFAHSAQAQSPARPAEIAPMTRVATTTLEPKPIVPGTLASSATPSAKPKPVNPFSVRVEPDTLPSWVMNQPMAYMQYGAAPAVVTLHFGHKDNAQKN